MCQCWFKKQRRKKQQSDDNFVTGGHYIHTINILATLGKSLHIYLLDTETYPYNSRVNNGYAEDCEDDSHRDSCNATTT